MIAIACLAVALALFVGAVFGYASVWGMNAQALGFALCVAAALLRG